jgi:hypothetical protein
MNHIEVGEEVRVFTSGERHRAAMKALREAGIRLADPPRFAVEQVEALAEVVATFGQLGWAADGTITRPGALACLGQSEFLGRLLPVDLLSADLGHSAFGSAARSALPATGPPWSAGPLRPTRATGRAMTTTPAQCFGRAGGLLPAAGKRDSALNSPRQ